jgi:hypothetical protein
MPSSATSASANPLFRGWLKVLLLAVLFFFSHIQASWADTFTVTQNTELTFGTMQIPGGSVTDIISPAGAQSGTGTFLYGPVSEGDYTITCTGTCTTKFSFYIAGVSPCWGVSGISASQVNYQNGAATGTLPFPGGLTNAGNGVSADLKLGTTATYTSSVVAGTCALGFNFAITEGGPVTYFPENANIGFDVALALTKNADINFGTVNALNASTYRISTAGTVSTVSGTGIPLYGATAAGNITIVGSTTDGITISAGGYIADNGVTSSNAQCSYDGGAAAPCAMTGAAPGSGKTLLVGVDVATDGTQAGGTTAAPTFTISVAYQ